MNCPNCGRYLGEGMLPARCPNCGANLANPTDSIRGSKASVSRLNVEGLTGIGKGNTSGRRRHYIQVSVALLLALGGVALLLFAWRGFGAEGELTVPDVVGWRQDRASEELVELGYGVVVETVYDETQMDGVVTAQEPLGGVAAVAGSQVRITVATSRVMPGVVGLGREEAEQILKDEGIPFTVREEFSDEAHGQVIEASAGEGSALAKDESVELVVAVPPTMPDVVGKTQAEATELIEAQHLAVDVSFTVAEDAGQEVGPAVGSVVSQDPEPGRALAMDSRVRISVATTRDQQLRQAADLVLAAVYDTDPAGDRIGYDLLELLSPQSRYAGLDAHRLWYDMVKGGGKYTDQPDELQSLPRSLQSSELTVDEAQRTVTAKVTVHWDWTGLPGATATESEDTRTVTMTFDADGRLVDFKDEQTDVPYFTVS